MIKKMVVCIFPDSPCGVQQVHCTHYIRDDEGGRVGNGTVYMGFRSEMDNGIGPLRLEQTEHGSSIRDIAFNEKIIVFIFYIPEVLQVTCVSELVQVDDSVLRIGIHEMPYQMGADKTCSAGNQYRFHAGSF
jgi:hypothetical protein